MNNPTKFYAIILLFVLASHYIKSNQEIKGSGKNEPTWDNPPDWVPGEFNSDDKVVINNMDMGVLKTTETNSDKEKTTEPKKEEEEVTAEVKKEKDDADKKEQIEKEKKTIEDLSEQLKNLEGMNKEDIKQKFAEEEKAFVEKTKKEMGLDTMEVISKELFRKYLTKIMYSETDDGEDYDDNLPEEKDGEVVEEEPLTKEEKEEDEFMAFITDEIMNTIPDTMNQEEFNKYAETEKYQPIIDGALKKKFGNNYHEDMVNMMKNGLGGDMGEGMPGMPGGMPPMGDMKTNKGLPNLGDDGEQEDLDDDEDEDYDEDEEQVVVQDEIETTDDEESTKESSPKDGNFADDMHFDENDSGEEVYEKMKAQMEKNPKEMEDIKNLIADKLKNIKVETKDGKDFYSEKDKEDL